MTSKGDTLLKINWSCMHPNKCSLSLSWILPGQYFVGRNSKAEMYYTSVVVRGQGSLPQGWAKSCQ
ncbi:hypothetical protein Mapa_001021 [Marchantia paleacea]|nr:hypothetical protein Mapa_001021 [Marchantia paleacea]